MRICGQDPYRHDFRFFAEEKTDKPMILEVFTQTEDEV